MRRPVRWVTARQYFLYQRSLYETPQEAPSVGVMECEWKALVSQVRADKESDEENELKEINEAQLMAGAGAALTAVPISVTRLGHCRRSR